VSTVAVPLPEQSGAAVVHWPEGAEPVWSSKSEQITAPEQPAGGCEVGGVLVGDVGGVLVGDVGGVVGSVGSEPFEVQPAPLRAKAVGVASELLQVPCSPKDVEPPLGIDAL
jgi:hypothetical protein